MKTFITKMNSMNECGKGNAKEKNEEAKKKNRNEGERIQPEFASQSRIEQFNSI